jgi:glutathione S-transferase
VRLHYHPLSSYSRKVVIGIGLRGDAVDLHVVDPFKGELKTPEFLAKNPFGKMPVLDTDDVGPIFESTSILEYLEARGPRRLIPVGQELRARHFDRLGDLYLMNPLGKFFWDKSDAVRIEAEQTTAKAWRLWERELSDGRSFLCGSEIMMADISAAVAAEIASHEGVPMPEAVLRYKARLDANPVIAAARDAAAPFVESTKPRRLKKQG